MSMCALIFEMI